jgi:hypothetical protein
MKLITLVCCVTSMVAGSAFGQLGLTLKQCTAKYGAVIGKEPQEWHKFKTESYYLEVHFYKDKADAVSYLNWVGRYKPFTGSEIQNLLKQVSDASWEVMDDGTESTMFVVKGFTAIHMKLDHILIVATDGYLERGAAAKAEAEAAKLRAGGGL